MDGLQVPCVPLAYKLNSTLRPKQVQSKPGTLAACCKPSSGAGVNWMDLAQVLAWRKPGHVNGDRHKVPERSYHLATTPGRWTSRNNEARRLDRKCNLKPTWIGRSRVRIPRGRCRHVFNLAIIVQWNVPILLPVEVLNHCM